ncbi:hypothetical protein WMF45_34635 [Sorangium sp. So ce448]|uniref:hypothetical protein n=1 Tax=Sorangium sp. So ce448 TaxID=3133314 RepID=UPI003F6230E7
MADNSPPTPAASQPSAHELFRTLSSKLNGSRKTIDGILGSAGIDPDILGKASDASVRLYELDKKIKDAWSSFGANGPELASRREELRQQVQRFKSEVENFASGRAEDEAIQRVNQKFARLLQREPGSNRQAVDEQKRKELADAIVDLGQRTAMAESSLRSATEELLEVDGQIRAAEASRKEIVAKPSAELSRLGAELDEFMRHANALHKEATAGRSLAEAGVATVEVNRGEFEKAREYHRGQAGWAIVVLALGTAYAGLVVIWIFGDVAHLSGQQFDSGVGTIASLALLLSGRFSVLLGIGYLLVFAGKLHSRHSQQAVLYQDRLAGLDAAKMIIHYGSTSVREEILKRMTTTYLSLDTNAFQPPPVVRHGLFTTRDVTRIARATSDVIGAATKPKG